MAEDPRNYKHTLADAFHGDLNEMLYFLTGYLQSDYYDEVFLSTGMRRFAISVLMWIQCWETNKSRKAFDIFYLQSTFPAEHEIMKRGYLLIKQIV